MKRIKLLGLTALLFIASFVNSDCTKCEDVLALCDLAITAFTAPSDILLGQTFDAVTKVTNFEDRSECTTTEIAAATHNSIEVFQNDGAGNWNFIVGKDDIQQGSIFIGDLITLLQSMTINQVGEYRTDYYDDRFNSVQERNEGNNYGQSGRADLKSAIQKTNNFTSIYITIYPLPDGTTEIKGKPIVEFN